MDNAGLLAWALRGAVVFCVVAAGRIGNPLLAQEAAGAPAEAADAAGYRVLPPLPSLLTNRALESQVRTRVKGMFDGRESIGENKSYADNYFTRHYFPLLTQTSEKALQELPEERQRFVRNYLWEARSTEAHDYLVDLSLTQLPPIVQDNFHPAVRYNALLILGSLNSQEAVRIGDTKKTPEPHLRALPVLYAELTRPENSDLLRVAALIGIVRHMEWDAYRTTPIPPAQRAAIITALTDLAQQKVAPDDRSSGGHQWLRRRAIEGLGYSMTAKADPAVTDALNQILIDANEPIDLRCAAASAMGGSNYVAPVKLDVAATVKELGRLAVESCVSELDRVENLKLQEEERQQILSGQPGGSGGGPSGYGGQPGYGSSMRGPSGYGGESGMGGTEPLDPKAYRLEPVRRRMRARLQGVQTGLQVEKLAKPAEKKNVDAVVAGVRKLIEVIEGTDYDLATLDSEVRRNLKPLDDLTRRAKPVAAPAGDDLPGGELPGGGAPAGPSVGPTAGAPAGVPVRATGAKAAPPAAVGPMP